MNTEENDVLWNLAKESLDVLKEQDKNAAPLIIVGFNNQTTQVYSYTLPYPGLTLLDYSLILGSIAKDHLNTFNYDSKKLEQIKLEIAQGFIEGLNSKNETTETNI